MIISGYDLSVSRAYAHFYAEIGGQEVAPPAEETAPEAPPAGPLAETKEADNQKVRGENGVLRLLQEGHFQPHAEMRLLEIFHHDLAILRAQNAPLEPPVEELVAPPERELEA